MRRRLLTTLLAPAVLIASALPAVASGPVPPPDWPQDPEIQFFYDMWFGPTDPDWIPQGTIVADASFRPYPNGMPYANYGGSLEASALFFGTGTKLIPSLNSASMRDLYGDGVCADKPASNGSCTLTPAAAYMSQTIVSTANGVGHCVGFAVASAAVYSGLLEPQTLGAKTLGAQSQLTAKTQAMITRQWATQFTLEQPQITPAQVVETLLADLKPATAPYVMFITGTWGGHGILPYAVYDRGNGLYDIAVYDNNYPNRERAIHVDTVANTWEYEVEVNPSEPPTIASGDATTFNMLLASTADAVETQPCPVCAGGRDTNLLLAQPMPTAAADNLNIGLLNWARQPLAADRYNLLPPMDSANPELTAIPGIDVDPTGGYIALLDGTAITEAFPLELAELSVHGARVLKVPAVPAGTQLNALYGQLGSIGVTTTKPVSLSLTNSFSLRNRHYTVSLGGSPLAPSVVRGVTLNSSRDQVTLTDVDSPATASLRVHASLQVGATTVAYHSRAVDVPAAARLVLLTGEWTSTSKAPQLWLDLKADGKLDKRIPMRTK